MAISPEYAALLPGYALGIALRANQCAALRAYAQARKVVEHTVSNSIL